jgi:hypothetical protein
MSLSSFHIETLVPGMDANKVTVRVVITAGGSTSIGIAIVTTGWNRHAITLTLQQTSSILNVTWQDVANAINADSTVNGIIFATGNLDQSYQIPLFSPIPGYAARGEGTYFVAGNNNYINMGGTLLNGGRFVAFGNS